MKRPRVITIAVLCGLPGLNGIALGAVYDFSTNVGVDRFAFGTSVPDVPIPPTVNTVPPIPFSPSDYASVAMSDDVRYSTGVIEGGNFAATRFVFTIAEPPFAITRIDVLWEGGANEDGTQSVWLWNAVTASYAPVGTQAARVPPDGTVVGSFTVNPSDFVDGDNAVTVLVNYNANGGALLTDYMSVTITATDTGCEVDADCDDGLFCNGIEWCDPVVGCQAGTPIDCDDGNDCTTDSCNETTDSCDNLDFDYAIIAIDTLGGPSNSAYGINDLGQVVGSSSLNFEPGGDSHGYLWDNGVWTDLGTLGGSNSIGFDINNAGQVTGLSEIITAYQHAFLWQNGTMTDLMTAYPTTFGSGWGINESGLIVGHLGSGAFLWENGVMTDPGSIGYVTRAYGVNNAGQVVGESGLRAFFFEDDDNPDTSDMRDLGTLPGGRPRARARGINDSGQVVGEANFGSTDGEDYHAVLWENLSWDEAGNYTGDITDLGYLPGGQRSFAYAVNNSGQVVGYATSVGIGASHAFVYDSTRGMQDLNDLIPPGSGWLLRFAMDINDLGQIVGSGYFNGQTRGFLLTPVCGDIPGDLDGDGDVDLADFVTFAGCFGLSAPAPNCSASELAGSDLDGNGTVDLADFVIFAGNYTG